MNYIEAFSLYYDLDVRGYDTRLVYLGDGKFGVTIRTKAGPSVRVSEIDFLDVALDIVEQLARARGRDVDAELGRGALALPLWADEE